MVKRERRRNEGNVRARRSLTLPVLVGGPAGGVWAWWAIFGCFLAFSFSSQTLQSLRDKGAGLCHKSGVEEWEVCDVWRSAKGELWGAFVEANPLAAARLSALLGSA
jgi:hypothetical protein